MKNPLMLPAYLCGECGIEMLLTSHPSVERAAARAVTAACYTPRCSQKGVAVGIPLLEVSAASMQPELPLET
jgi:hypothetical protein